MPPPDRRDRLLIFDFPSNYSEQDILTFPLDIGSIEYLIHRKTRDLKYQLFRCLLF